MRVELHGRWNLHSLRASTVELLSALIRAEAPSTRWDLTRIDDLDAAGATLLWKAWRGSRPAALALRPGDELLFERLATLPPHAAPPPLSERLAGPFLKLGLGIRTFGSYALGMVNLLGDVAYCGAASLASPANIPWREISATIYRNGLQALPITALVGFLIGIVLSYLSGQQLHQFGADEFIVNLMGIATLRELGPLLAAILNAGRSGSSMTAQIGVMRVTGELEAMDVMGISATQRLVLPKVIGQLIAMPLVVLWTSAIAMLGGMLGAKLQLGVAPQEFIHRLPQVVPAIDLWFGLIKGALFGGLVALVSCYFGLRIRPDTEGLALGTTESVVTSLTLVLLLDAILAMLFSGLGQ
jgi:phospholipid/cholesterol/gamma-HCH transport system permease protein